MERTNGISIGACEEKAVKEILDIHNLHLTNGEKEMWRDFDFEQLRERGIIPKIINLREFNDEIIDFACDRDFCKYARIPYGKVDEYILDIELAALEFYKNSGFFHN